MENTNYPKENESKTNDFYEFDTDAYPIWTCTNRLRWKRTRINIANAMIERSLLQQLWQCSTGSTEWREVEYVD